MKRNCNLELRLMTTPSTQEDYYVQGEYESGIKGEGSSSNDEQLTIFYNGRIANCEAATEFQARAIIRLAYREMEEKSGKSDPHSRSISSPIYSPSSGLSMKRSLKRFLEKRKNRTQAASPYTIARDHPQ